MTVVYTPPPPQPASDRVSYKQGFPAGYDREQAKRDAVAGCAAACAEQGMRMAGEYTVEIVETDAHRDAGEYLVKVVADREPID